MPCRLKAVSDGICILTRLESIIEQAQNINIVD
uniref:Uncharacterized protein n=2 Tax=Neisseria meningitidis TaxID=487 RepID=C6SKN0_NEIME|nr:hypothetical protein predicted by Glimmer/Critica [Neisseria meningitidis alpha153]CBA08368.1 hypothetical protein predicted by Glimmer/Critica [Neisseria meningitidis alpha275]